MVSCDLALLCACFRKILIFHASDIYSTHAGGAGGQALVKGHSHLDSVAGCNPYKPILVERHALL